MGINGLLPLLKSIHRPVNLKKFDGQTIGVDAYGWLHRGTVACAMELALGKPTRKFVDFCMHRVRMLQHFGVIPYLVFDGDYLPSKAATEADRAKRRGDSRRAGLELLNAGKTSQAYLEFQKAVDVTPEMARQLIDELKRAGVQFIVAPYEADAQMVYLERQGIISGILSEDSDLLVFGAKCLLTKLDQYGNCVEINKNDFCACKEITLTGWSDMEFRRMAILSGCDYLASINNMGLKTAYRMVRKHKTIEKVLRMLQFDGKFHVPKGYLEAFYQAEFTFLHQRVFCPRSLTLVLHTEPESSIDEESMPYIGAYVEPQIAQGVARGDLNPITKLPIVVDARTNVSRSVSSPWLSSGPQAQRSASTPGVKKDKPIETFFKPKRIPLAELDPNCFTLSPSQEQVTRRNSGPWAAIPTPRPYLNPSSTISQTQPHSAPPLRTQATVRHIRTPTVSEPRPQKRVRLCADIESILNPGTSQKVELGRSRFFVSDTPEPSPTVGRTIRRKRAKKQDITIFSDDSVEEAMRELPDFEGFSNKIVIYKGEREDGLTNPTKIEAKSRDIVNVDKGSTTSSLIASGSTTCSASSAITPNGSHGDDVMVHVYSSSQLDTQTLRRDEIEHITPSAPSLPAMTDLKSRFSFGSLTNTPQSTAKPVLNLKKSTSPRPSRIPLAVKTNISSPRMLSSVSAPKPRSTLERLRDSATNHRRLPLTPPMTTVLSQQRKSEKSSPSRLGKKWSLPFPEVENVGNAEGVCSLDPASVPLPVVDDAENEALRLQSGSEDLIVHDSEGDEEGCSPREKVGREGERGEAGDSSERFKFARFVFAG